MRCFATAHDTHEGGPVPPQGPSLRQKNRSPQLFCKTLDGIESYVHCSAPQLFSKKSDLLGYSILQIDDELTSLNISYRQWARDRFVAGTMFSKNDTGTIRLSHVQSGDSESVIEPDSCVYNRILALLQNILNNCLKCYACFSAVWVVPNIADQNEFSANDNSALILAADMLREPFRDCFVIAHRQFGLSSLGRYLALAARKSKHR